MSFMNFDEEDYILGIWSAQKNDFGNVVIFVKKDKEIPDKWEGVVRFRYFEDPENTKIFNHDDRKSGISFEIDNMSEEEAIKKMREMFDHNKVFFNDHSEELLIQGGLHKVMEAAKTSIWLHLKEKGSVSPWEKSSIKINKSHTKKGHLKWPMKLKKTMMLK